MKYAHYNKKTGKLIGYFDDTIHQTIPEPNIQITEEQWQEAIDNGYNYVEAKNKTLSYKDFRTEEEKLNDTKKNKINYLKQNFLETLKKGYVTSVSKNRFYTEEQDIAKLKNAYDLAIAANVATMKVKTLDGRIELSVNDVKQALLELGEYYQSQLQKLWDLEEQVSNATNIEEVEAIKWED